jgi:hypothetical protein
MKIVIEFSQYTKQLKEEYNTMDLVEIFDRICTIIDKEKIATFTIFLKSGSHIATNMDFSYDFTSIMPNLDEVIDFINRNKEGSYKLNLYELDIIIDLAIISDKYLNLRFTYSGVQKDEYFVAKENLIFNIQESLFKFYSIVYNFFPKACAIFIKEDYLGFSKYKFIS